jgi:MFS family permease
VLGVVVSAFSYGASNFLPLYFQDVLFVSPTESGLRMLPIMAGVVIMSTTSGRLIARTGRYRIFPILGTSSMAVGVLALTQIAGDTRYWYLAGAMFLLGVGSGMVYPVTSIATQNACEMRDMGVATASLMFFRSLGGSLGLAVFGTILNATIRAELPGRIGTTADEAVALIRAPEDIQALPDATRTAVIDVLADGISTIYWACLAVIVVGVVWAFLLPELPLRAKSAMSDRLAGTPSAAEPAAH